LHYYQLPFQKWQWIACFKALSQFQITFEKCIAVSSCTILNLRHSQHAIILEAAAERLLQSVQEVPNRVREVAADRQLRSTVAAVDRLQATSREAPDTRDAPTAAVQMAPRVQEVAVAVVQIQIKMQTREEIK